MSKSKVYHWRATGNKNIESIAPKPNFQTVYIPELADFTKLIKSSAAVEFLKLKYFAGNFNYKILHKFKIIYTLSLVVVVVSGTIEPRGQHAARGPPV